MAASRAFAAFGLMVAVAVGMTASGCSTPKPSPQPAQTQAPSTEVAKPEVMLDGAYRMDVAVDKMETNGAPDPGPPFSRNFGIRSACTDSGCVATLTRLKDDDPNGLQGAGIPLDYINGQWVVVEYAGQKCESGTGAAFSTWRLDPQPDGSLSGTRIVASFGSAKCTWVSTMPMTLTRTGDVPAGTEIDDPAGVPPRIHFPAEGLSGRYDVTAKVTNRDAAPTTSTVTMNTLCARVTPRCLTVLRGTAESANVILPMLFADGAWTTAAGWPNPPCTEPNNPVESFADLSLPQPTPSPITTLTGQRSLQYQNGCPYSLFDYALEIKRTGD